MFSFKSSDDPILRTVSDYTFGVGVLERSMTCEGAIISCGI